MRWEDEVGGREEEGRRRRKEEEKGRGKEVDYCKEVHYNYFLLNILGQNKGKFCKKQGKVK